MQETEAPAPPLRRRVSVATKIAYRLYLLTMRFEGMKWLRLRAWLVGRMTGRSHSHLNIFPDVFIEGYQGLKLGDHVSINRGSNISAEGGLEIGNYVAIGHATSIMTGDHGFADRHIPIKYQPVVQGRVTIGSNVWIGAKVSILAGVEIADGTIIAAGAVVTRSVTEPDTVVGGVPARFLKSRFD